MASDDHGVSSTTDTMPNVLTISPTGNVDIDLKQDIQDDEEGITVGSTSLLASQAYLVSPSISNPTLQSLLNTPSAMQGAQLGLPEGIQIITVPSTSDLLPTQTDATGRIWHVINPENAILTVGDVEYKPAAVFRDGTLEDVHIASADLMEASTADVSSILMPPPQQPLPPGCPAWAARLKNCEKIGDYYRGYVDTEVELDILLTYHKQATQSFWGTRQSPSPAKQSTRFMWKSQYVPWDGVPFVNTGSRAVVMECQYGPRRKGSLAKKQSDSGTTGEYKQTCPARIYIKKVRKFPEYKIDPNMDKKSMKNAMDKAFHDLKLQNIEKIGQDRFYVQLPLQSAHEFHDDIPGRGNALATNMGINATQIPTATNTLSGITHTEALEQGDDKHNRLHPMVVQKIRDIVAGGEVRVYHVRRLLRMYVVREICNNSNDMSLQRHDLTLFPTVTDLKNQIHQAVKDIENGTLALTAPTVNVEPMNASGDNMVQIAELNVWPQTMVSSEPVPETVTVTLTQSPGDDGGHVISRIETHLSDGSTQISTSLTPETAQLLARLNPSMFPPGSLVQLQSAGSDVLVEDQQTGMEMNDPVKLEHAATYGGMHMETPESMNHEESPLTIQADSSSSLAILPLENSQSEASNIITTENHSIAEQSSELISVTMVPTVAADMEEELQTDSCDEDL